jgi:Tfp pilus assembly protein PilE
MNRYHHTCGFSLGEMLIAIGLLGLIAMISVPVVFNKTKEHRNKALFKDTIAAVERAYMNGFREGYVGATNDPTKHINHYVINHLNAKKVCVDKQAEGCYDGNGLPIYGWATMAADLHTGASIVGLNSGWTGGHNNFAVDINGPDGPNKLGKDMLWLHVCMEPKFCNNHTRKVLGRVEPIPGTVNPAYTVAGGPTTNTEVYNSLYD